MLTERQLQYAAIYSNFQKNSMKRYTGKVISLAYFKNYWIDENFKSKHNLNLDLNGGWVYVSELKKEFLEAIKAWAAAGLGQIEYHPLACGTYESLKYADPEERYCLPGSGVFVFNNDKGKEYYFELSMEKSIKAFQIEKEICRKQDAREALERQVAQAFRKSLETFSDQRLQDMIQTLDNTEIQSATQSTQYDYVLGL